MLFLSQMKYRILIICYFLLVASTSFSQKLTSNTYNELHELIFENKNNKAALKKYLKEYYRKAKQEESPEKITEYYRDFVFIHPENERIILIDSALHYAQLTNDNDIIGKTYLTKGVIHYNFKNYQETLNNYLISYNYISKTENEYLKNQIKYLIGNIKNYLGIYDEAVGYFEECRNFFITQLNEHNYQRGYISSLESLAWSYTKLGQLNQSNNTLQEAYEFALKTGVSPLDENYILFKQGINDYFSKNHSASIQKIKQTLPQIYENEDFAWGSIGELYLAKSYWDTHQTEKAIPHLLKIDKVFVEKNYTHPDLREAYEMLIKYYENEQDKDKQLFYTNRLIEVDKVFNTNYKNLSKEIYREYETKDLLQAKRDLEFALYLQKYQSKIIVSVSLFIIFLLGISYFISQRRNREKARELIRKIESLSLQTTTSFEPLEVVEIPKSKPILADELAQSILGKLKKLEDKEFYLKKDITLSKLAKKLETNSSYLSAVINNYKNKNFASYLNELRINYIAKEILKSDSCELQKYSVDAFADMAGYSNVKSFSDAFQKELDIKPSLFIKEVMKRNQVALVA